jgi:hypothetical protein
MEVPTMTKYDQKEAAWRYVITCITYLYLKNKLHMEQYIFENKQKQKSPLKAYNGKYMIQCK